LSVSQGNFTNNNNTALSLVDSNLVLEGGTLFDGNHAINGGALRLCDTSLVYISYYENKQIECVTRQVAIL